MKVIFFFWLNPHNPLSVRHWPIYPLHANTWTKLLVQINRQPKHAHFANNYQFHNVRRWLKLTTFYWFIPKLKRIAPINFHTNNLSNGRLTHHICSYNQLLIGLAKGKRNCASLPSTTTKGRGGLIASRWLSRVSGDSPPRAAADGNYSIPSISLHANWFNKISFLFFKYRYSNGYLWLQVEYDLFVFHFHWPVDDF